MLIRHPNSARGSDLYETPEVATLALLRAEALPRTIWEPACCPGAIVRVLRDAGQRVIATDLIDYHSPGQDHAGRDFLLERRAPDGVEMIVTNPPFRLAAQFAAHALLLCPREAMLLRLSFLESGNEKTEAGRERLFALDGGHLARVFVFIDRVPVMHRDGWTGNRASNPTPFAWYVWERGYIGEPKIHRVSWKGEQKCGRACARLRGRGHDQASPAAGRRDFRPAVLEPAAHGHRRLLSRRHAGRSLHRQRQDRR